jgi:hypothetical protein
VLVAAEQYWLGLLQLCGVLGEQVPPGCPHCVPLQVVPVHSQPSLVLFWLQSMMFCSQTQTPLWQ